MIPNEIPATSKSACVLASGGLDSTLVAFMAHLSGSLRHLVIVNYGQAAFDEQSNIVRNLASEFSVTYSELTFDYRKYFPINAMPGVFTHRHVPETYTRDDLSVTDVLADVKDFDWLEGRNALFMLMASIDARYHGCDRMLTGFQYNKLELAGNMVPTVPRACDTSRHLYDTINTLLFQSFASPFRIETPLAGMYKRDIASLAKKLMPKRMVDMTYSCENFPPCNVCSQCRERAEVLA